MKKCLFLLLLFFVGCNPPDPCDDYNGPPANYRAIWTHQDPESVDHYVVELSINGQDFASFGTTTNLYFNFDELEYCNSYKCRVIAVGKNGQMSEPSNNSRRILPVPDIQIEEEK